MRVLLYIFCLLFVTHYSYSQEYFSFKKKGKYGVISASGKITIEPSYVYLVNASTTRFFAYSENNRWEYINHQGVSNQGVSFEGYKLFNPQFSYVQDSGKWAILDMNSDKLVTPFCFSHLHSMGGLTIGKLNGEYHYISSRGKLLHVSPHPLQLFVYKKEKSVFLKNEEKMALAHPDSDTLMWFEDIEKATHYDIAKLGREEFLLSKEGFFLSKDAISQKITSKKYEVFFTQPHSFSVGQEGTITKLQNVIGGYFWNDSTLVFTNAKGKKGLYDLSAKRQVIPPNYQRIKFVGDFILGQLSDSVYHFMDKDFVSFQTLKTHSIWYINETLAEFEIGDKKGIYSFAKQRILVPANYHYIEYQSNGPFRVYLDNKVGVLSASGNTIVPCQALAVEIERDQIKAYLPANRLDIYYLNKAGNVTEKMSLSNVVTGNIAIKRKSTVERLSEEYIPLSERGNVEVMRTKLNTETRWDSAKNRGWFTNFSDTATRRYELKWGVRDTLGKVRIKPSFVRDVFVLDTTMAVIYTARKIVESQKPLVTQSYFTTRFYDYTKFRYKPIKLHAISKKELVSGKPIFLGFYNNQFHCISRHSLKALDTLSYISPLFHSKYRFVAQGGNAEYCGYDEEDRLMKMKELHSFIFDMDSISPSYYEPIKFDKYARFPKKRSSELRHNYFKINEAKWGVYDSNYIEVIPKIYDKISPYHSGVFIAQKKEKSGLIDFDSIVLPIAYDHIERLRYSEDSLFLVATNSHSAGLMDENGESIETPFSIQDYKPLEGSRAVIRTKTGLGIYDFAENKAVLEPLYSKIESRPSGLFYLKQRKKIGLADKEGNTVVEPQLYKEVACVSQSYFKVKNNRFWGLINESGDTVLPFHYQSIFMEDSLIYAATKLGFEVYTPQLSLFYSKNWSLVSVIGQNAQVLKNGKIRVLNIRPGSLFSSKWEGKTILVANKLVEIKRDKLLVFSLANSVTDTLDKWNEIEIVELNLYQVREIESKKWVLVDTQFRQLNSQPFRNAKEIAERYLIYYANGRAEIFDKKRLKTLEIQKVPKRVVSFKDGFFRCTDHQGKYFYLDSNGNTLQAEVHDQAYNFNSQVALVHTMNQYQLINNEGVLLNSFSHYSHIIPVTDKVFLAKTNQLVGIANNKGEFLIPPSYHKIELIGENWVKVYWHNEINYYSLTSQKWLIQ